MAGGAGFFDAGAGAAAGRTGLREDDDAAGAADLAGAAAGRAGGALGAGLGARAVAAFAGDELAEGYLFFEAACGLFEADFKVVAQIGAVAASIVAAAAAEHLLEDAAAPAALSEDFAEDVEGVVHASAAEAAGSRTSAAPAWAGKCGVAIAVVRGAFLRVL